MKIIGAGRNQKGWAVKAKCTGRGNGGGGCGARLLVEQADVFETQSSSMGETDQYATFLCGHCGRPSDLDAMPPFPLRGMTDEEREALGLAPTRSAR